MSNSEGILLITRRNTNHRNRDLISTTMIQGESPGTTSTLFIVNENDTEALYGQINSQEQYFAANKIQISQVAVGLNCVFVLSNQGMKCIAKPTIQYYIVGIKIF
jgi:hypothetical protein